MNTSNRIADAGHDLLTAVVEALENPDTPTLDRKRLAQTLRTLATMGSTLAPPDEVLKLIPRTPDDLVAFVGSNFNCFENTATDKEDWSYRMTVHDLLSSFDFHFQEIIYAPVSEANSQGGLDPA